MNNCRRVKAEPKFWFVGVARRLAAVRFDEFCHQKTNTYMKICVFSDFHGDAEAVSQAVEITSKLHPDKVVVCGDIFVSREGTQRQIAELLGKIDCTLYLIRGNNDYLWQGVQLPTCLEDNAVMYHFGRTLYFTHGDRFNALRLPPLVKDGDVLVHGHTHIGRIRVCDGVVVANVGSMALPRDGVADYMLIDEKGIALFDLSGNALQSLAWTALPQ